MWETTKIHFHPSYTSNTYAHEVHFDLHVLEELEIKQNGDEALALFQRYLEMHVGEGCINLEEAKYGT